MENLRKWMWVVFACSTCICAWSQEELSGSFNSWWSNINSYTLKSQWSLSSEVHLRRAHGLQYWQGILLRPAVYYRLENGVQLGMGYTYISSYPSYGQVGAIRKPGHNFFEHLAFSQQIGSVRLQHRYRLEHRWVSYVRPNGDGSTEVAGMNYKQRFRYRLRAHLPLASKDRWFVVLFDELWLNMEHGALPVNFNQNWLFIGLEYRVSKEGNIQLGFLDQYLSKGDGVHYEHNPTLQTTFCYQFEL
jgi:hypothetical protein